MSLVKVSWYRDDSQQPMLVGQLAERQGKVFFQYDAEFLRHNISLSPFLLPLQTELFECPAEPFSGLPGLCADALPDGWGLLLMDRSLQKLGINPRTVSPLDRLLLVGNNAMGALRFESAPDDVDVKADTNVDLQLLGEEAIDVFSGDKDDVLPALAKAGVSPGGARPKVLVGISGNTMISGETDLPAGYVPWLVKFHTGRSPEQREEGIIEFIYAEMARQAGIKLPETQLFPGDDHPGYFAIKRFDRADNNKRIHMHTLAGLVHANFRVPDYSYDDFIRLTLKLTRNAVDAEQAFRRMAFNLAAANRDDHTKNFAYLMSEDGEWRLSPAYDLTFNHGHYGEHTMLIGRYGKNIPASALYEVGRLAQLNQKRCVQIISEVFDAVSQWERLAKQEGVSSITRREIQQILNEVHGACK